ncbi:MAG TPA: class I SAM-dependent methyltransferase [Gaiellaceae bacterium]|jgi:SAM-dependent methyltransferase
MADVEVTIVRSVVDAAYAHPRLAAVYDSFERDRRDLDAYAAIAEELGARRVLDIGCGTGTFAVLLASRGFEVVAVDPAEASLDVARKKRGADLVRWLDGDATALPTLQVDLVTMTGNVAQAIVEPEAWQQALGGMRDAMRPGGHLVFETRDPAYRGWQEWTRTRTHRVLDIADIGPVERWIELLDVSLPLITFRGTYVFHRDGETLTSDSTLRFRERDEVETDLAAAGYVLQAVRDASDRPGRECVFIAQRPQ